MVERSKRIHGDGPAGQAPISVAEQVDAVANPDDGDSVREARDQDLVEASVAGDEVSPEKGLAALQALIEVQTLTSAAALHAARLQGSQQYFAVLSRVRELVETALASGHSAFYSPMRERLDPKAYVLPDELRESHAALVERLCSKRTNTFYQYRGLLLYGVRGTGKTEYAYRLATETAGHTLFVRVSSSAITNEPKPGDRLQQVYLELEALAQSTGKIVVALFDEGDGLFSPNSSEVSDVTTETSSSASESRSSETTRHRTRMERTVDKAGRDVLSSFKSVMGEQLQRVVTIVTSNETTFPDPLYRDGRLQAIQLEPVSVVYTSTRDYVHQDPRQIPVYDDLRRVIPWVIDVLSARYWRMYSRECPALIGARQKIAKFFEQQPPYDSYKNEREETPGYAGIASSRAIYPRMNAELLSRILAFFGYPETGRTFGLRKDDGYGLEARILGALDSEHLQRDHEEYKVASEDTLRVVERLTTLTPGWVSGQLVTHHDRLSDPDAVLHVLGEMFFPPLTRYQEYLAAQQKD